MGHCELIDSTVNWVTAEVRLGDYALDITAAVTAKVTAVSPTSGWLQELLTLLKLETITIVNAKVADDHDKMLIG